MIPEITTLGEFGGRFPTFEPGVFTCEFKTFDPKVIMYKLLRGSLLQMAEEVDGKEAILAVGVITEANFVSDPEHGDRVEVTAVCQTVNNPKWPEIKHTARIA